MYLHSIYVQWANSWYVLIWMYVDAFSDYFLRIVYICMSECCILSHVDNGTLLKDRLARRYLS